MSSSPTSKIPTPDIPSADEVKKDVVEASKSAAQSFRALAAGGVGGIFAVVVGHPFDLVKVRLQTAEKGVYTGAMDVVRRTMAKEGFRVRLQRSRPASRILISIIGSLRRCLCTSSRCHANVYVHYPNS